MTRDLTVTQLAPADASAVTRVLCAAFADYPVMRFVLGDAPDYHDRLTTLIGLFVAARALRGDAMFGIADGEGGLVAAATVTLPGEREMPARFAEDRERVWGALGGDARARYEAFGAATSAFERAERHHHLNMIGVVPAVAGRGFARALLDHVHAFAAADPESAGVSLTTELHRNVGLYEHFGYIQTGHATVSPVLQTWGMFRRR